MRLLMALLILFAAPVARAESTPLPALYDVIGVAADDVLNIRSGPGSDYEVIGRFSPTETGIEVVAVNGPATWAMVALPEGEGWVARRYLRRQDDQEGIHLPATLACGGTEPFWAMSFPDDGASGRNIQYSDPESDGTILAQLTRFDIAAGAGWGPYLVEGRSPDLTAMAIITRASCSDGMSDRPYGFAIFLDMKNSAGDASFLHGCCALSR